MLNKRYYKLIYAQKFLKSLPQNSEKINQYNKVADYKIDTQNFVVPGIKIIEEKYI